MPVTKSANGSRFLSLGGDPVLDFCNTQVGQDGEFGDRLVDAKDLADFWREKFDCDASGFKKGHVAEMLLFRTKLKRVLTQFASDHVEKSALEELNSSLSEMQFCLQLEWSKTGMVSRFQANDQREFLAPLVDAVFKLLRHVDRSRLKKCGNPVCTHLFYDVSKNNQRTWCSMKSCGNIMKARAFYQRHKND